jgi:hypothetical protein
MAAAAMAAGVAFCLADADPSAGTCAGDMSRAAALTKTAAVARDAAMGTAFSSAAAGVDAGLRPAPGTPLASCVSGVRDLDLGRHQADSPGGPHEPPAPEGGRTLILLACALMAMEGVRRALQI